jgi:tetratricopeptide (TPR) repeat protein
LVDAAQGRDGAVLRSVGSTSLGEQNDPEVLRALMLRYHAAARGILERHGGTVEKFVGDAAMAVFGVPQVHEDDALRAARAAMELREAVGELGLEARIGVNTGEVVVDAGETLVAGDAVNVAARLEQAAPANAILLGEDTRALLGDAVRAEPLEPLKLKGKAKPVPAWELRELLPDVPAFTRPIDSPFVGRAEELDALEVALAQAPQLVTVVGPPGIGKSRLVRELVQRVDARVLVGRCLSYGEGITYLPLEEILGQIGNESDVVEGTADEIAMGFRMLLERLARERPLVVVLDDIHWAEPALLDLIEYLAAFVQDAPLLLLCTARPDLFEVRPAWAVPSPNTMLLLLEPLEESESEQLVSGFGDLPVETRRRIVEAAEGNPLFVEQLVAMDADRNGSDLEVPPTIQAVLAARIDRLQPQERAVIERAAVEGRSFHRGAVAELLPEKARTDVGAHLLTLARKELIRPDRATVPGDDGFRFAHILVRDAAYESIAKRERAELHERYADWLERKLDGQAPGEILAYHLEQAYSYGAELGSPNESLGRRAASLLVAAANRAHARDDSAAVVSLLERAFALPLALPWEERFELRLQLITALADLGRWLEATAEADAAADEARAAGDRTRELTAVRFHAHMNIWTGPDERLLGLAEAAVPELEAVGDAAGLMHAWRVIGLARIERGRHADAIAAFEAAVDYARRADADPRPILLWMEYTLVQGPMPAREMLIWVEEHSLSIDQLPPESLMVRAFPVAAGGQIDEARELLARGEAAELRLGRPLWQTVLHEFGWYVEVVAGDHERAEYHARRYVELTAGFVDAPLLQALSHAALARSLCALGRYNEAAEAALVHRRTLAGFDPALVVVTYPGWEAEALVLAHRGDVSKAERRAREIIRLLGATDALRWQVEAAMTLAEVLEFAGKTDEAVEATSRAAELFETKGLTIAADRARGLLASRRGLPA